jgi:hypothetical protein
MEIAALKNELQHDQHASDSPSFSRFFRAFEWPALMAARGSTWLRMPARDAIRKGLTGFSARDVAGTCKSEEPDRISLL